MIREIAATQPEPQAVLIDLGAAGAQDIPTLDLIADVAVKLRARGVTLMFAQVRGAVRDRLDPAHVMDIIGPENIFAGLAAGVDAYKRRYAVAPNAENSFVEPQQIGSTQSATLEMVSRSSRLSCGRPSTGRTPARVGDE